MGAFAGGALADLTVVVGGELGPLQQSLNQIPAMARAAGEAAAQAMRAAAAGGDAGSEAFNGAALAAKRLADAMATTTGAAIDLDKELQRKQTDAGNAADAFQKLGQGLTDAGSAMLIIGGVLTGISAGLIELATNSLEAAGKMEQQRVAMENLSGSAAKTDTLIKELVEFAIKTPFEIPGVIEMGQKLVAMGTATTDVIPLLRTLGDTASGSGKGFAGLNVLVQDFGKMSQLGVVHMRELNTLAYQGVPAIKALADAYGVSANQMRKMVEENMIDAADAMPILIRAMNDKFGGMMEAQSKTLLGMWANLKDTVTKTFIAIGDALIPIAKRVIEAIMPILEAVQQIAVGFGQLPASVQGAIVIFGSIVTVIGPVVVALGGFLFTLGKIISSIPALTALLTGELPLALTTTGNAATTAATKMGVASTASNTLATGLGILARGATLATIAFTAWELGKWAEDNIPAVKNLTAALGAMFDVAMQFSGLPDMKTTVSLPGLAGGFMMGQLTGSNEAFARQIQGVKDLESALKGLGVTVERGNKTWEQYQQAVMDAAKEAGLFAGATEKSIGVMNATAMGVNQLRKAQEEANAEVVRTKQVWDAMIARQLIGEESTQAVRRAQNAYNEALKKAQPELKGVAQGIKDIGNAAARTEGAQLQEYIKLWTTIPWETWQGDIQATGAAMQEQGFSINKTVAALKKLVDGWEKSAGTSKLIKDLRDEAIGIINVLNNTSRSLEENNRAFTGWKATLDAATGVTVWRQVSGEIDKTGQSIKTASTAIEGMTSRIVAALPPTQEYAATWADVLESNLPKIANLGTATEVAAEQYQKSGVDFAEMLRRISEGEKVIPSVAGQIKILTGSVNANADAARANAESWIFMSGKWVSASELGKKVSQTVGSYEAPFKAAGAATAEQTRALDALMMSAKEFQRVYGGSMADARAATDAASDSWGRASKEMGNFQGSASLMAGSFMEGMNGMTASGEQYIAMLAQLGALDSDIARAAQALGYREVGPKQFVNEAYDREHYGADFAEQMWHPMEYWKKKNDEYWREKAAADAKAMEDHAKAVEAATHKYDDLMIQVNGLWMTVKEYNEYTKQFTDKVYKPLAAAGESATKSLSQFADGLVSANEAADIFQSQMNDANKVTKSTVDMWREFPNEMQIAQGQTIQQLIDLGINFYDAVEAVQSFGGAVSDATRTISRATQVNGAISDLGQKMLDMAAKDLENPIVAQTNTSGVEGPVSALGQFMLDMAKRDMSAPLVQAYGGRVPSFSPGMSRSPTGPGFDSSPALMMEPAGGGVVINMTGNYILDNATADRLVNQLMTRATTILRQNAGLKV